MSKINTVNGAARLPLLDKTREETIGCSNRTTAILIVAWLVIMTVLVACNSGSPQPTQTPPSMPALEGATLLETRCSACHSADRAKQAKKTPEQWGQTVTRMIGKGAQLTEAEKAVLVDYLAKTYGP